MLSTQKLRQILADKKMSQAQLSRISGVPESRISEYMREKFTPTTSTLGKIAEALDVEIKDITVQQSFEDTYNSLRSRLERCLEKGDTEMAKVISDALSKLYKPVDPVPHDEQQNTAKATISLY